MNTKVDFVQKNMSILDRFQKFDYIINWNNSFGYFSHDVNIQMLYNFHDMLNDGGSLIIECENMNAVGDSYPRDFSDGSDIFWNPTNHTMHYHYGGVECVRIHYSISALESILKMAGFKKIQCFGNMFSEFNLKSERVIIEAAS